VDFSPRGSLLASGSFDESVRLWDVRAGRCIRVVPAHSEPITSVQFSKDGTLFVTGSYDGLMCVPD
jgi:COMPASS component SWD3